MLAITSGRWGDGLAGLAGLACLAVLVTLSLLVLLHGGTFRRAQVLGRRVGGLADSLFAPQCFLLALGLRAGFIPVMFAVALGNLVSLIPISISGLGTREAATIAYLRTAGVQPEAAFSFSLLVFITFYIGGGVLGGVAWWVKPAPLRATGMLRTGKNA